MFNGNTSIILNEAGETRKVRKPWLIALTSRCFDRDRPAPSPKGEGGRKFLPLPSRPRLCGAGMSGFRKLNLQRGTNTNLCYGIGTGGGGGNKSGSEKVSDFVCPKPMEILSCCTGV